MQRRRSALLAWAIPFVALLAAAAVPSDVDLSVSPIFAQHSSPTTAASAEVPALAATTPASLPFLPAVLSPPSVQATSTIETTAPDNATTPAVVAQEPVPPPPSETSSTEAQPAARGANEYVLEIPSIELSEPVVAGDQAELDQGAVTAVDWSAQGYPASCLPGEGCTVWLAGHRTTHGAVFARLPELGIGDPIAIHFHGQRFSYTVTSVADVPGSAAPAVITGDLVLQTSLPGDRRLLIYADSV